MAMIRTYELSKRRSLAPRLVCFVRRFPRDVAAEIRYSFNDGVYTFRFPSSWVAPAIADEVRRFVELVNSPHWRETIEANLVRESEEYILPVTSYESLLF